MKQIAAIWLSAFCMAWQIAPERFLPRHTPKPTPTPTQTAVNTPARAAIRPAIAEKPYWTLGPGEVRIIEAGGVRWRVYRYGRSQVFERLQEEKAHDTDTNRNADLPGDFPANR